MAWLRLACVSSHPVSDKGSKPKVSKEAQLAMGVQPGLGVTVNNPAHSEPLDLRARLTPAYRQLVPAPC